MPGISTHVALIPALNVGIVQLANADEKNVLLAEIVVRLLESAVGNDLSEHSIQQT
jgi:hypothetical protein